jgi:hypothetical protein
MVGPGLELRMKKPQKAKLRCTVRQDCLSRPTRVARPFDIDIPAGRQCARRGAVRRYMWGWQMGPRMYSSGNRLVGSLLIRSPP